MTKFKPNDIAILHWGGGSPTEKVKIVRLLEENDPDFSENGEYLKDDPGRYYVIEFLEGPNKRSHSRADMFIMGDKSLELYEDGLTKAIKRIQ